MWIFCVSIAGMFDAAIASLTTGEKNSRIAKEKAVKKMFIEVPNQREVIRRYGPDAQALVHTEELAELIQAVSKMRRVRNKHADDTEAFQNLVEEVADVIVCLTQMQQMYGATDELIQSAVNRKCARMEARLREDGGWE